MTKICDNKSVGMLIWKDEKLLLIERKLFPFGFAPPAGHVDEHGSYEKAVEDETREEVGLKLRSLKLVIEGRKDNRCRREGGGWHYWKIYKVEIEGDLNPSKDEAKQAGWYSKDDIKKLTDKTRLYLEGKILEDKWRESPGLEPVWYQWFEELGII